MKISEKSAKKGENKYFSLMLMIICLRIWRESVSFLRNVNKVINVMRSFGWFVRVVSWRERGVG